ncbi:putative RDD family membrane protein YckC [Antricoccus suffuscus]|uniref:Putative RDD family membrane protein YckC n=1 Tax=Antricoccus suffuscus TaxID=1629062 RepID=A0A2T0ZZ15_9ACTN|nr:RDD family protein [Antricoccus suffuscus]PRZ41328.1 putative RDD family membrane protein YckC [Antricoccus suffuscus]
MPTTPYPGQNLGLPQEGPTSVATYGRRVGAFVIDAVIAGAITWIFTVPDLPQNWSLLTFFVIYTLSSAFLGRTPGMMATRIRLATDREGKQLGLWRAAVRTVLTMIVVPAVISDGDRRGLHDKAVGTTVVND